MKSSNILPFNPLDKKNLGASVAEAMLEQTPIPLGQLNRFRGSGIYAIYYVGDCEAYEPLAVRNRDGAFRHPIYVGKAVPSGARKGGGVGDISLEDGQPLYKRLREHAESISAASDLNLSDFFCRFLVVDDIWIPLGESLLIAKFTPIWNVLIDGFGNHNPGKGRFAGMRPRWDVLHPGRDWALKCGERIETRQNIIADALNFFTSIAFPASHHILGPSQQPQLPL